MVKIVKRLLDLITLIVISVVTFFIGFFVYAKVSRDVNRTVFRKDGDSVILLLILVFLFGVLVGRMIV
jgi:uncharacterized membrane protein YjfL (UPF0719 family)